MSQINAGEDASLIPDLESPEDIGIPKDQTPSEQQDNPSCTDDTASPTHPKSSLAEDEYQETGDNREGSSTSAPLCPQEDQSGTEPEGQIAECGESVSLEPDAPDAPTESEVQFMCTIVMLYMLSSGLFALVEADLLKFQCKSVTVDLVQLKNMYT